MLKDGNSFQKSLCHVVICPYFCGSETSFLPKSGAGPAGASPRVGRGRRRAQMRLLDKAERLPRLAPAREAPPRAKSRRSVWHAAVSCLLGLPLFPFEVLAILHNADDPLQPVHLLALATCSQFTYHRPEPQTAKLKPCSVTMRLTRCDAAAGRGLDTSHSACALRRRRIYSADRGVHWLALLIHSRPSSQRSKRVPNCSLAAVGMSLHPPQPVCTACKYTLR